MNSRQLQLFRCALVAGTTGFIFLPDIVRAQVQDSAESPSSLSTIVVSATRSEQAVGSLPSPVRVIGAPAIAATPTATVPDLLRTIPGFALRDYQSGMIAGPSQSIVTFRGLGGSSAGRVLVLLDGVPIGDPFSGWLDWGRIPLSMLASAEVVSGGGSIVWGSRSLGGVVNLRSVAPRRDEVSLLAERGTFDTWRVAGTGSIRRGKLGAVVAADYLDTDGFVLISPRQAGPVDQPEAIRNRVVSGKLTYDATPALQGWVAGSIFDGGQRPWGTEDDQEFDEARGGLRWAGESRGIATISAFANRRESRTRSYGINSARTAAVPQRFGTSPARSGGLTAQWTQVLRQRHELTTGLDFSTARGSVTEEYAFAGGIATQQREAGGDQQLAGFFVQDAADLGSRFRMVASARVDRVHSTDGRRRVRSLPALGLISDSTISDHTDVTFTYSLGFRRQQSGWLGLRANVYEAFRTPSMYEMYHPRFSSRGTVTEANSQLEAERLKGAEAGVDLGAGNAVLARVTMFTNQVASPIMDITIGTAGSQPQAIAPCGLMPAGQTCLQRQNVSSLRSNGLESDVTWRLSPIWRLAAGYSYNSTRVKAPGQPADGKRAIRAAQHSAVSTIAFDRPRWLTASLEARYVGPRFEDDLNEIELDGFYLVGLRVNRELGERVGAYLKIENLLDEEFEITRARSGLAEVGARRWVTLGLRTAWQR